MNRNEFLEALPLTHIVLKLTNATLEICMDVIDDIHVMVSGADAEVQTLNIAVKNNQLLLEQPMLSMQKSPNANSWLQVTIRLPQSWKGHIDARTVSGWITVRGLSGTDLTLDSVSGVIKASYLLFQTATMRTVTGDIRLTDAVCTRVSLGTTSGGIVAENASLSQCTLTTITGSADINLRSPFRKISANSVTGNLSISAPIEQCCVNHRCVSGRLNASEVSIVEQAEASVQFNTVAGDISITHTILPEA